MTPAEQQLVRRQGILIRYLTALFLVLLVISVATDPLFVKEDQAEATQSCTYGQLVSDGYNVQRFSAQQLCRR